MLLFRVDHVTSTWNIELIIITLLIILLIIIIIKSRVGVTEYRWMGADDQL